MGGMDVLGSSPTYDGGHLPPICRDGKGVQVVPGLWVDDYPLDNLCSFRQVRRAVLEARLPVDRNGE